MGGLTTPKGGDTRTTTAVNQVPGYVSDAQQNLYGAGQAVTSPFLQSPSYGSAGINADQSGAYDLTRYLAQSAFTPSNSNVPTLPALKQSPAYYNATGYNPQGYNAQAYNAALAAGQGAGDATMANAARVAGGDFQEFMNPYTQAVIDPAVANLRRQSDISAAQIGAQSAAAGSYGGSRQALQQAQNTRALGEQTSQMVSQLMSQGYTQAQAIAQANAQMQQQTALTNASAANNMAQFNTNAYNTNQQFNANAANTAGQFNAGSVNTASQQNSNAANTAGQFGASATNQANASNQAAENAWNNTLAQYGLSAAQFGQSASQIQDALQSSDQTRKMQAIQALLGIGNAQQTTVQNNLNLPLQYLQALAALTPSNTGGTQTTTAPNTAQSPLQTLLGTGLSVLGMGTGGGTTVLGNLLK